MSEQDWTYKNEFLNIRFNEQQNRINNLHQRLDALEKHLLSRLVGLETFLKQELCDVQHEAGILQDQVKDLQNK